MKKIFLILIILTSLNIFSQKEKAKSLYAYTYSVPEWYIPNNYSNYYAKINLSKDYIKVFADKEHILNLDNKIGFNAFFKKRIYTNMFSAIRGFTRLYDQSDFSDSTIEIVANVINPRLIIKTKEKPIYSKKSKDVKPFSYELYFSYEIEFLVISVKDKKVLYKHIENSGNRFNFSSKVKRELKFKDKNQMIGYVTRLIPKTDIISEMLKSIMADLGLNSVFRRKSQFIKNKNSFFYFYKLSKQKKYPLIKKMNDTISKYMTDVKNQNKIERKIIKEKDAISFNLEKNKTSVYLPASVELSKKYRDLALKLEKDLTSIYANLDLKDKVEKKIAWACMINIAKAFYSIGDFKTALKYFDKAKLIDFKTKKTEAFRANMIRRRDKLNIFYAEDGKIKKDVNSIYLRYLKDFAR